MASKRLSILAVLPFLTGCAKPAFVLTDESAMRKLMATRQVAALQRQNPSRLICYVEGSDANARNVYLGEDHPDHTVRVGAYRVTADGRVWVNADPTLLEDRWMYVE